MTMSSEQRHTEYFFASLSTLTSVLSMSNYFPRVPLLIYLVHQSEWISEWLKKHQLLMCQLLLNALQLAKLCADFQHIIGENWCLFNNSRMKAIEGIIYSTCKIAFLSLSGFFFRGCYHSNYILI